MEVRLILEATYFWKTSKNWQYSWHIFTHHRPRFTRFFYLSLFLFLSGRIGRGFWQRGCQHNVYNVWDFFCYKLFRYFPVRTIVSTFKFFSSKTHFYHLFLFLETEILGHFNQPPNSNFHYYLLHFFRRNFLGVKISAIVKLRELGKYF